MLLLSLALAAPPVEIRAAGLGEARAAQVLVQVGADVSVSDCNDAGVAPDRGADGIWSCTSLAIAADKADVALLRDGVLLPAGTVQWPVGPRFIVIRAESSGAVASTEASALPPALPAARPAGPGAAVLARLTASPAGPTPMITLAGPAGSTQLSCRNDGHFPDTIHNDGIFGCSGVAPGATVQVSWRGPDGAGRSFGTVGWDAAAPVRFLTLDGVGEAKASIAPFSLALTAPSTLAPTPAGNPPARPPVETPEAAPYRIAALAAAAAFGGACVWLLRRPFGRVPRGLRALPAPPLLPGGPSAFPASIQAEDPEALAAALLPTLAARGRVVLATRAAGEVRWEVGGPVYAAANLDRLDLGLALRLLAREGPTPTLLVVGRCLEDPGAAVGDPIRKLLDELPTGLPAVILLGPGEAPVTGVPVWAAAGPPWRAERRG